MRAPTCENHPTGDAGTSTPRPRARSSPVTTMAQAAIGPAWPHAAPPAANRSSEKLLPSVSCCVDGSAASTASSSAHRSTRPVTNRRPTPVGWGVIPTARAGPRPTDILTCRAGGGGGGGLREGQEDSRSDRDGGENEDVSARHRRS